MAKSGDKFRQMEDEMSRFEAEISGTVMGYNSFNLPGFGNIPPPPMPPLLVPNSVRSKREYVAPAMISAQPAVVSAKPALYSKPKQPTVTAPVAVMPMPKIIHQPQSSIDLMTIQNEVEKKLKKLKNEKVSAELAISQGKASSALQSFGPEEHKRRSKNRKLMRTAGGTTWEDHTLSDWIDDDFRIFCGDLGNDVTDELLTRTFNKFPSFLKAKVIRDKRTNKSKGYGFVSFKEPGDFTKAMKEMNGRYVGSRPIKLRKSSWKNRSIDVVRKKEKEKQTLLSMLASGSK